MTKYITRSEYYDTNDGIEISKKIAIRDYIIIKKTKIIKTEDKTKEYGYEYKNIIITWINHCEKNRQLKLI